MAEATIGADGSVAIGGHTPARPKLDVGFNARTVLVFFGILGCALFFIAYSVYSDVTASGVRSTSWLPFLLLGVALFIALGFEFVNGFHDTANAVATVIYTHSLPAHAAVVWSGLFNFLGVLASTGAVAFGILALFIAPENARYVQEVGYVPLPPVTLLAVARRLDKNTTGTIFGGRGSVLGVTASTFQDEDKIKSALVQ
jgi:hypothetical protein